MNKKYVIIGVGIFILLLVTILSFLQKKEQQSSSPSAPSVQRKNSAGLAQTKQEKSLVSPGVSLAPPSSDPRVATKQFYTYYFSSSRNLLADGAYKTNPYLSPEFKNVIGAFYHNGNDPVFCPQNKSAAIVVGKQTQVLYENTYLMQEVISQAPPGTKDLYTVLLQNNNNKWLIFDVNCLP